MKIADKWSPIWEALLTLPNKLSLLARLSLLVILPMVAYYQDFVQVFNLALSSEETQYILLVPVFIVFFLYIKRRAFLIQRKNTLPEDFTGISLCITAILTYVWGTYSIYSLQLHLLSLPILFAGMILILFGTNILKITIFPIALLAFLSPLPALFMNSYGGYLTNFLAQAVVFILSPFIPLEVSLIPAATISGISVGGAPLTFTIGAACAGINFLVSFLFLSLIFGYLAVGSMSKKIILIIVSLVLAFALNIFRIALMVVIGHYYGMDLALGFFHLPGGMILLSLGALLILIMGSKMLHFPFFEKNNNKKQQCVNCNQDNDICNTCGRVNRWPEVKINWKKLAIILFFLIVVTDILALASAATYNSVSDGENSAISIDTSTGAFQPFQEIPGYEAKFTYRETSSENILKLIFVGHYTLIGNATTNSTTEAIFEVADIQSKFHTWEGCLHYQSIPINIEKTEYSTFENDNNLLIIETITADAPTTNQKIILTYWFDSLNLNVDGKIAVYATKFSLIKFIQINPGTISTDIQTTINHQLTIAQELESSWANSKKQNNTFAIDLYKNKQAFANLTFGLLLFSTLAVLIPFLFNKRKVGYAVASLSPQDKIAFDKIISEDSLFNEELEGKIEEFKILGIIKQQIYLKDSFIYKKWIKP